MIFKIFQTLPVFLVSALFFLQTPSMVWSSENSDSEIRGELFARQFTTLSSEMAARITHIPFREGETFKKQQLLVKFDCDVQIAKLTRAKAILKAENSKAQVLSQLDQLNVTSKLELTTSMAEEAKAHAELAIIKAEIKRCQILAPFSGQVVTQSSQEHQYVKAGQTLLEIHNPKLLELKFHIPSHWLKHIKIGHPFLVKIHETSKSYSAKITSFGARIDAVGQVIQITGKIKGIFPELKPGMSGQVKLAFGL